MQQAESNNGYIAHNSGSLSSLYVITILPEQLN